MCLGRSSNQDPSPEFIACLRRADLDKIGLNTGYHRFFSLNAPRKRIEFIEKGGSLETDCLVKLISYGVIINEKREILSFRRPKLATIDALISGKLCIAFGGHINSFDYSAVSDLLVAAERALVRELTEELGISFQDIFRYCEINFRGTVFDRTSDASSRSVGVVFEVEMKEAKKIGLSPAEDEIKFLSWASKLKLQCLKGDMESWSSFVFTEVFKWKEEQ